MSIESYFWSYNSKNHNRINFKHKKMNYTKKSMKSKKNQSSNSIIQKITTESTLNTNI